MKTLNIKAMQKNILMILTGLLGLFFLHAACALELKRTDAPVVIKKVKGEGLLLADFHKAESVSCTDCHREGSQTNDVPTDVCLSCHEGYLNTETTHSTHSKKPDPHKSHMEYKDCNECHHGHKPSVDQCSVCHEGLGFRIR